MATKKRDQAGKVLIVDDETKVRTMYRKLLAAEAMEILEAGNGEEAGLLLIQHTDINLVLLDIRMPVVSGAVLFDLIKLHNPQAKVIVTSVYPLDDQRRIIDGADGYHDKSEGMDILLNRIHRILPGKLSR